MSTINPVSFSTRKSERFEARLTPKQKELIQRAADLSGRSLTDFIVNSAQAAAEETIRNYQVLELTARETEAFFEAPANPPEPSKRLQDAVRDYLEFTGRNSE